MTQQLFDTILRSSQDPRALSLTVRGILMQLVPVILLAMQAFGIGLIEGDVVAIIENITQLVAVVLTVVGLLMTAWGLIRKMFDREAIRKFATETREETES